MRSLLDIMARTLSSAFREVRPRTSGDIPRLVAALCGVLAVAVFLGLPIVQVSFLGMDFTRTGMQLIQSTFASSDWLDMGFSVAMTLALIAAGLGSFLCLGRRHRDGSILGGLSLAVLIGLCVYLFVREDSPKMIAVGLWLSVTLLTVMSSSKLMLTAWSRVPRRRDEQGGGGS